MVTGMQFYRRKRRGVVIATELILIVTILCFALAVGLTIVRQALVEELLDVASALSCVEQEHGQATHKRYRVVQTANRGHQGIRVFLEASE